MESCDGTGFIAIPASSPGPPEGEFCPGCPQCEPESFPNLQGSASGARDETQPSRSSQSTGAFTENGIRLHDQHCAWCDCEEFVAVKYGSLHHLTLRAVRAVQAVVAVVDNPHCPECGSPEKRAGCVTCADGW